MSLEFLNLASFSELLLSLGENVYSAEKGKKKYETRVSGDLGARM